MPKKIPTKSLQKVVEKLKSKGHDIVAQAQTIVNETPTEQHEHIKKLMPYVKMPKKLSSKVNELHKLIPCNHQHGPDGNLECVTLFIVQNPKVGGVDGGGPITTWIVDHLGPLLSVKSKWTMMIYIVLLVSLATIGYYVYVGKKTKENKWKQITSIVVGALVLVIAGVIMNVRNKSITAPDPAVSAQQSPVTKGTTASAPAIAPTEPLPPLLPSSIPTPTPKEPPPPPTPAPAEKTALPKAEPPAQKKEEKTGGEISSDDAIRLVVIIILFSIMLFLIIWLMTIIYNPCGHKGYYLGK